MSPAIERIDSLDVAAYCGGRASLSSKRSTLAPSTSTSSSKYKQISLASTAVPQQQQQQQQLLSSRTIKIAERLTKAVEEAVLTKSRSPELIPLTADYEELKKKLRNLISVVKRYQQRTMEMHQSKTDLVEQLAAMAERSPIQEEIGCELDGETADRLQALRRSEQPGTSVARLAEEYKKSSGADTFSLRGLSTMGSVQAVANDREYQALVVDYVVEWEGLVTERVDKELKNVRKLEADRRHYERKVEQLRQRCNELQTKGRPVPPAQAEKSDRNEQKLREAYAIHEREAGRLCALIEAATHEGYKDLLPLVKNYMKWEMNRVGRESDIATQMSTTLEVLTKHGTGKKTKASKARKSQETVPE